MRRRSVLNILTGPTAMIHPSMLLLALGVALVIGSLLWAWLAYTNS
jgi:hypothetical protein